LPPEAQAGGLAGLAVRDLGLRARGVYQLQTRAVNAQFHLQADRVSPPGSSLHLEDVDVAFQVTGAIDNPELSGNARAKRVELDKLALSAVSVSMRPGARGSTLRGGAQLEFIDDSQPPIDIRVQ